MPDPLLDMLLRTAARRAMSGDAPDALHSGDSRRDESSVVATLTHAGPRLRAAMALLEPHCAARLENLAARWPYVRSRRLSARAAAGIMDSILTEAVESAAVAGDEPVSLLPGNPPVVAVPPSTAHEMRPPVSKPSAAAERSRTARPGTTKPSVTFGSTATMKGPKAPASPQGPGAMPAPDDSEAARRRVRRKKDVDQFLLGKNVPSVLSPLQEHTSERHEAMPEGRGASARKESASPDATHSLSPKATISSAARDTAKSPMHGPAQQARVPSPPSVSLLSLMMHNRPAAEIPSAVAPQAALYASKPNHTLVALPSGSPGYLTGATPPARPGAPVQTAAPASALGVAVAADAFAMLTVDTPKDTALHVSMLDQPAGAIDHRQDAAGPVDTLVGYAPGTARSAFAGRAPSEHHRSLVGTAAARTAAPSDAPKSGRMSAGASSSRSGRRRPRQSDTSSDLPSSMYIW